MHNVIYEIKQAESFIRGLDRWRIFNPINFIVIGYIALIFIGALILMLPWSTVSGHLSFTNALFTSTSATTVTGLVVKETGKHFTSFGQLVICLLIQIGGIGYMSIVGLFIFTRGERITFEYRMLLHETINSPTVKGIMRMAKRIFLFIIGIEFIGAVILMLHWWPRYDGKAVWYGAFHSIAAFNNAGFDILATGKFESFARYTTDITVNLIIASLVILGGIGFYVLSDIYRVVRGRKKQLSYQAIVVGIVTAILLIAGTIFFLVTEYNNPATLGKYGFQDKLLISFFNSVTPRTAGFSTIAVADFFPPTLLFIIALMFIGASPGGTGGGVKTTTIAVFWGYVKKCVTRKKDINVLRKRISEALFDKALAITVLSIMLVIGVSYLIVYFDNVPAIQAVFETVSAFGTVGLTMGLTPYLSTFAKYLIMLTMFAGKIGILTLLLFFAKTNRKPEVILPTGELTM